MKNKFLILLFAISLFSCSNTPITTIENFKWLNGTWSRNFNGNQQLEKWEIQNNAVIGSSSFINRTDTTEMTNFKIINKNGHWVLISKEVGFEKEVSYTLSYQNQDSIVFYNANADWPQTISFKNVEKNVLAKTVLGKNMSMKKNIEFTFKKNE
jgi:hypothetical protein